MIMYKTTNLINGKSYIGRDKHNNSHYLGSGKILKFAIKKYGRENFKKTVIEETTDITRETYWIIHYDTMYPNGYNLTLGGDGGETTQQLSKQQRQRWKNKISKAAKRNVNRGIGITGKSQTGRHITESCPSIKEKWDANFKKSMEEYSKRIKSGILTEDEITGRQKLKRIWSSKGEREKRSKRQTGSKNSNYRGPYALYDEKQNLIKQFQFITDIINYAAINGYKLAKSTVSNKIKTKKPFYVGKWKTYTIISITEII